MCDQYRQEAVEARFSKCSASLELTSRRGGRYCLVLVFPGVAFYCHGVYTPSCSSPNGCSNCQVDGNHYREPVILTRKGSMVYVGIYYLYDKDHSGPFNYTISVVDEPATLCPPGLLYLLALCSLHSGWFLCCKRSCPFPSRRTYLSKADLTVCGGGVCEQ